MSHCIDFGPDVGLMEHNLSIAIAVKEALFVKLAQTEVDLFELNNELRCLSATPGDALYNFVVSTYCPAVNCYQALAIDYKNYCDWIDGAERYVAAKKLQISSVYYS